MKIGILILSDRSSKGERPDGCGPTLVNWLTGKGMKVSRTLVIPDEMDLISETLIDWSDNEVFDLILTSGGTGVSPRDVTPEATERILHRQLPGFAEEMRRKSLEKTPHAIISRAIAGIRGATLIINLPGSPKGAMENLDAVWTAIPHAVAKIKGDASECAPSPKVLP